jgi:hypothetical protein
MSGGDLQALDVQELSVSLAKGDIFSEGNPFVGRTLQTSSAPDTSASAQSEISHAHTDGNREIVANPPA